MHFNEIKQGIRENVENVGKQENDYQPVEYYCSITNHDTDITKMIGIIAMPQIVLDLYPMKILEQFTQK